MSKPKEKVKKKKKTKRPKIEDYTFEVILPKDWENQKEQIVVKWVRQIYWQIKGAEQWPSLKSVMHSILE